MATFFTAFVVAVYQNELFFFAPTKRTSLPNSVKRRTANIAYVSVPFLSSSVSETVSVFLQTRGKLTTTLVPATPTRPTIFHCRFRFNFHVCLQAIVTKAHSASVTKRVVNTVYGSSGVHIPSNVTHTVCSFSLSDHRLDGNHCAKLTR